VTSVPAKSEVSQLPAERTCSLEAEVVVEGGATCGFEHLRRIEELHFQEALRHSWWDLSAWTSAQALMGRRLQDRQGPVQMEYESMPGC
jgi:hypothetical protein